MSRQTDGRFCSKHQGEMAKRIRFLGLKKFVSKRPEDVPRKAQQWLAGTLSREELDPIIILDLELRAHAVRIAVQRGFMQAGKAGRLNMCSLCAIQRMTDDDAQDVKSLVGYGQVVLRLFQANGLVGAPDGLAAIPEPHYIKLERPPLILPS